jgi:hypothetical protein
MTMRHRLHQTGTENGAVAVIVAILVIVLFGFTALAVDVARMYGERRELQRTADASALAGARELVFAPGNALSEGEKYIDQNPTIYHPSAPEGPGFSPSTGDSVIVGTCEVPGLGVSLPCVTSRVVAPKRGEAVPEAPYGFNYLFAGVLGIDDRAISATSIAVVGRGAPGGDKLVPWLVSDCPNAKWDGVGNNTYDTKTVDEIATEVRTEGLNVNCTPDYAYSEGWSGTKITLFLDDAQTGNFQGADFADTSGTCPLPNGAWPNAGTSGKKQYEDILSGTKTACNIDRGARIWTEPGQATGPTKSGLDNRPVGGVTAANCMNPTRFDATIDDGTAGDGFVSLKPGAHGNPCLVVLALVVHPQDDAPNLTTSNYPGDILTMQERVHLAKVQGNKWDGRFAPIGAPGNGGKELMLVRRFALFYITERSPNSKQVKGLFLRAFDSHGGDLAGGECDPTIDAICVVKLIPTD